MSSAILYLAIVAIWACVLIPRWLRRDSARGAGAAAHTAIAGELVRGDVIPDEDTAEPAWADARAERDDVDPGEVPERAAASDVPRPSPGEARQRMLAARRRLFGMLFLLEVAAIALAVSRLAALWVLIPPSVMLAGYLLLLREVARADSERTKREEEAARARASERAARAAAHARAAPAPAFAGAQPPARHVAGHEDAAPGRDFAPGLAGKYTTSNAAVIIYERDDEEPRDQYPGSELRAVGD